MIDIDLKLDASIHGIEAYLIATQSQIELATRRTLNKTIRFGRSLIARNVAHNIGVKVKIIRNSLRLKIAKGQNLEAEINLNRAFISAVHVKKSTQRNTRALKGHAGYSKVFKATMKSGHKGLFKRRTKDRLKIDKQYVMWQEEGQQQMQQVENQLQAQLQKNFEHELNFILNNASH